MFKLQAKKRDTKENLEFLRKSGQIPAVFYGSDKKTTSISINKIEFDKIWKEAGESSTITLESESGKIETLIHDVQVDPISNLPIHIDFLVIDINKPVEVEVSLDFTGISPAIKNGLGILVKVLHEVQVEALPKDLPHEIKVDISTLENLDDQILAKDVILPSGVTMITDKDDVVVMIGQMKEEKEEEIVPVDISAIEVEKKGKKEDEGTTPEA
ncbi:MAG: 50S ribosomal protein L25 [Candidatus Paceibacterota bacterium]|jgi:large subunit ribosomal protein L25